MLGGQAGTPAGVARYYLQRDAACASGYYTEHDQVPGSWLGDGGTARQAKVPGYRVAGKTGTADRVGANGRYSGKTASFIGFAPADNPQFVVAVILQNPIRGYFGGSTAGPVFKDVMTYALQEFKIPPTGTPPPVMKLKIEDAPASADRAETALKAESGLQRQTTAR